MPNKTVHPYVAQCERYLELAAHDALLNEVHLKDLVDYLKPYLEESATRDYAAWEAPFVWSYTWTAAGKVETRRECDLRKCGGADRSNGSMAGPDLMFLSGYPSPGWLNTIGYKYQVDPHFYLRHMSFQPSVQMNSYAEPSLPSNSGHILKFNIPTIGHIDPVIQRPVESLQVTRQRCTDLLRQTFRDRVHKPRVGSSIVRRLYIHDWKRFTLEQELSICLLRRKETWSILIWTDSGGEDQDPELPLSELPAFKEYKYDFKICPTVLRRSLPYQQQADSPSERPPEHFNTRQTFNVLHRVHARTLKPEIVKLSPIYALNEVFAFAAATENQFLNMIDEVLNDRMESLTLAPNDENGPKGPDIQYDRNILDAHRIRIKEHVAFLTAHDDSTWFEPFKDECPADSIAARLSLTRDFQHLEARANYLVLRCERAMEMIMNNASLTEARFSNQQSVGVANLTRMTTLVTIVYVPSSFVCAFFGMNFSDFGQGDLSLWIYASVSIPVLVISLTFLYFQLRK